MWSSGEETHQNNSSSSNGVYSSSSISSSSTSSCPSPFSSSPHLSNSRKKTMEEVWKDISLTNLQDKPTREEGPRSSSFRNVILQDFLARPFKETPTNTVPDIGLFGPSPPPPTVLSLNSGPDFHYLDPMGFNQNQTSSQIRPLSHHCFNNSSSSNISSSIFDGSPPATLFDAFRSGSGHKRVSDSDNNSNDRRFKRMIKNRESAARSRARKQAWLLFLFLSLKSDLFFCCGSLLHESLGFLVIGIY